MSVNGKMCFLWTVFIEEFIFHILFESMASVPSIILL